MSEDMICKWCGEEPAVALAFSHRAVENGDETLCGMGIGWSETQELILEWDWNRPDDQPESDDSFTVEGYCSCECLHLDGEFRHAMAESD